MTQKTIINKEGEEKNDTEAGQYDDCEICRAMQGAEKEGRDLSEAELMEAFTRQNKINSEREE
ncbi:MAG: hypothetical protein Q7S57_05190 [bacterium]|nr:hypothetical protein [bacterium]